jgi:chemotaxis protein MotB
LLAFFIVLNSIAVQDESRTLEALGSLTGSFGILPGGLSASKEGEIRVISMDQVPIEDRKSESVEIEGLGKSGAPVVDVQKSPTGKTVTIQDKVMFDQESYKIKPSAYGFLRKLCEIVNLGDYPVEITGHTDDVPHDEKAVYSNQQLSSLRALEVLKFFVTVGKVSPERLLAYGCGENRPIASNETRQTRARNRRVDILLSKRGPVPLEKIYQKNPSALVVFKRFVFRVFD